MLTIESLYTLIGHMVSELKPPQQSRRAPVVGDKDLYHTLIRKHDVIHRAEIVKDRHIVRAYVSEASYVDIKIMVMPDDNSRWYWTIGKLRTSLNKPINHSSEKQYV